MDAVRARTAERARLRAVLEHLAASRPTFDPGAIDAMIQERLVDWKGLLRRRVEQGQQILKRLIVGQLALRPCEDDRGRYFHVIGTASLEKLLGNLVPQNVRPHRESTFFPNVPIEGEIRFAS